MSTLVASDDFTGTANTLLSTYNAKWSQTSTRTGNDRAFISNAGRVRSGYSATYWVHADTVGSNLVARVECDLITISLSDIYSNGGVVLYHSGGKYLARLTDATYTHALQLYEGDATNSLGTLLASETFNVQRPEESRIRMDYDGGNFSIYLDDVLLLEHTEAAKVITGAGLMVNGYYAQGTGANSRGVHIDNWAAYSGGGGSPKRRTMPLLLRPY